MSRFSSPLFGSRSLCFTRRIKVLAKLLVIVDETDEKAKAKEADLLAHASREGAKVLFGGWIGQDLALYGPEDDLREKGTPPVQAVGSLR